MQPHLGIVDLYQEIKVAALPGLAPDIGAEDAQRLDLPLFGELRLMLLQDLLGSSLFCVGGLESWSLTRNSKDTTAMTGSISIAHHARLIARLCLRD